MRNNKNDISKLTRKQLINAALKSKFGRDAIDPLIEIVSITPNPDIATLILLGEYEEPNFPEHVIYTYYSRGGEIRKFISYDKWEDKVEYANIEDVTKGGWFKKGTKESSVTLDNFESLQEELDNSKDQPFISLKTGGRRIEKSFSSADAWISASEDRIPEKVLSEWINEFKELEDFEEQVGA